MKAGVVYFDHQGMAKQKRLFIASESRHLPGAVLAAANDMRSQNCRNDWLRRLKHDGLTKIPRSTARVGASGEPDDLQLIASEKEDKIHNNISEPALKYQFQGGSPLQRQPKAFSGLIASSE